MMAASDPLRGRAGRTRTIIGATLRHYAKDPVEFIDFLDTVYRAVGKPTAWTHPGKISFLSTIFASRHRLLAWENFAGISDWHRKHTLEAMLARELVEDRHRRSLFI
jgi:hypothetical protein